MLDCDARGLCKDFGAFLEVKTRLTPHFVDLLFEATLKSFWRKASLRRFLREIGVSESFLTSSQEESKRETLERLFEKLNKHTSQEAVFAKMARALTEQKAFPDLEGWEDSKEKIADAKQSVKNLASYVKEQEKQLDDERKRKEAREHHLELQQRTRIRQNSLEDLSSRLTTLFTELGTQAGGYRFQEWFYDFLGFYEVPCRRPYTTDGRQIDGSVTLTGTTYLVELKFTAVQVGSPDIDTFVRKVTTKADNTMGVFVSMSGFNPGAIREASKDRTPIILLDHQHVYYLLSGVMSFPEIVERVRRHASQTGSAHLGIPEFSG